MGRVGAGMLVWAGVALSACAVGDPGPPATEVADSAGVRIVTADLGGIDVPVYVRVGAHDLEVGVVDGAPEYTFSRVADVAVSGDGSLVVSDAQSRELRVYDATGLYLRSLGGAGDGPGEFASTIQIAGLAGDTVVAWDSRSRRVTVYTLDGELVGIATLQSPTAGRPRRVIRFRDGTFLSQSIWLDPTAVPLGAHDVRADLDSVVIEHIDGTGELLDTVTVMPDMARATTSEVDSEGRFLVRAAELPLSSRAFLGTDGSRGVLGHGSTLDVAWHGRDGPEQILRVRGAWPSLTGSEIRARMEAVLLEESGGRQIHPMTRRLYDDLLPEAAPVFGNLLVAANGAVWIRRYDIASDEPGAWVVFASDGALLGRVTTPPGLRVFVVGDDFVVGVVRDDLDIPFVRRYPFQPAVARGGS